MLALALLPLLGYFAFLAVLYLRRTPTVLNGALDFTLLAWGLFGLVTLGPGKMIIPIYVFAAWNVLTWGFWVGSYFAAVYFLAMQFRNRFVVYHCQREVLLPAFYTLARRIDPKTEWSGNVLSLHGLNIQWSVVSDKFGGCLLFSPTNPLAQTQYRAMMQEQLTNLCRTLPMPKGRQSWGWCVLTLGLALLVFAVLVHDFAVLVQTFEEYWRE